MKVARPYLVYIIECIANVEELSAVGQDALMRDDNKHLRAAILYYLHTLAEAAQRIPDNLKARHTEIDWDGVYGFRNRLVHGYLEVNFEIVWGVIQNYLPDLKVTVEAMLLEIGSDKLD